ncbi:hypothetical protein DFH29DRAFT_959295 [Suillus ampliporus]|nr:hypothetical protein DFH29DRAFT_959295 [Suillus ampliporus]
MYHLIRPPPGQLVQLFLSRTPSKLRLLAWFDKRLASIPTLRLPLPTVETLSICISDTQFRKSTIPDLRTAAPRLKVIQFDGIMISDYPLEIESLLLSYPEGFTKLSFICCNISSSLLHGMAPWPCLRWLSFQLGFESILTVPLHVSQPFQALAHLHIACPDLDLLLFFSRAFRMLGMDTFGCSNLKKIHINAHRCSPASSWSKFLSILTRTKLEYIIMGDRRRDHAQPLSFDLHPYSSTPPPSQTSRPSSPPPNTSRPSHSPTRTSSLSLAHAHTSTFLILG